MALVKLDENVADLVGDILRRAGHDVRLARDQQLTGVDDQQLLAATSAEGRALVTFDMHFSDIRRHPPEATPGIIVLRLRDQTFKPVGRAATALATLLSKEPLVGRLWVLDEERLRIWPGSAGPA